MRHGSRRAWLLYLASGTQHPVLFSFSQVLNDDKTALVIDTDMPMVMVNEIKALQTLDGRPIFRWGGDYRNHKVRVHCAGF